ncbi:transposase [Alteromonas sp. 1_MG-2023]|uniref:transposase n=1 Tax=Alteromonas sp. 1_MG-2023 TaxID=3062669 RepID=UPI0026E36327|nr:transposase [Alteromonas sp. 1_MG-2023]MDO6568574.1 transposase [Alteromonas sp. 1_MG-2023]
MARKRRLAPPGFAQHVIQRGNNRAVCFANESDYFAYIYWLKKFSIQFNVSIHAWVLMTNHIHLLCTPQLDNHGLSTMMQSLGRMYVRYFNQKYKRTGTLWEGRFNSSLINSEEYLLTVYQYIELNPVRAAMVSTPCEYKWSSYAINALGVKSTLCTPHPLYLSLGQTVPLRLKAYRALFETEIPQALINNIQSCSKKELVLGNAKFKQEIEKLTE